MVSENLKFPYGREKMKGLSRQSDWTEHLNRSKSIRLRSSIGSELKFTKLCQIYCNNFDEMSINHTKEPNSNKYMNKTEACQKNRLITTENMSSVPKTKASSNNHQHVMISTNYKRYKRRQSLNNKNLSNQFVRSVIFITILIIVEFYLCHCDLVGFQTEPIKLLKFRNCRKQFKQSDSLNAHQIHRRSIKSSSSHNIDLIKSLSDNIERQHSGLGLSIQPVPGPMNKPSKYDAEHVSEESKSIRSTNAAKQQQQRLKTQDDIMNQHFNLKTTHMLGAGTKLGSASENSKGNKADQDMQHIMMLHESGSVRDIQSTKQMSMVSSSDDYSSKLDKHISKLKSISKSPLNIIHKSIKANNLYAHNNTKLLSDVLNYLGSNFAQDEISKQNKLNTSNSTSPFTPRTTTKSFLARPLLGIGQMFASPNHDQKATNEYGMPGSVTDNQASYILSNAINQPQGYSNSLKGRIKDKKQADDQEADSSSLVASQSLKRPTDSKLSTSKTRPPTDTRSWILNGASQMAQSYFQNSFRDLLTLSQLPILSGGSASTAPSEMEPGGKKWLTNKVDAQKPGRNRTQAIDELVRYAYILGNLGVRRKRDPLKALGSTPSSSGLLTDQLNSVNSPFSLRKLFDQRKSNHAGSLKLANLYSLQHDRKIKPRGVMWDMATDPSLAVTVFHLLERASVALPLGFLLMPFVHMIRNPLNGINLGRIIPARASHRSVDYEELARRIDMMDRILSRALKSTHRESLPGSLISR